MKLRKFTAILTSILLLSALVQLGCAEPEPSTYLPEAIVQRYTATDSVSASLSISSGGVASCTGKIQALASGSSCKITTKLLRKSGNSWTTVETWSGSGSGKASAGGKVSVSSGTYKVTVSGSVTAADGTRESVRKSSAQKTCA